MTSQEYLSEPIKVGFAGSLDLFPVVGEPIVSSVSKGQCRGFECEVVVSLVKVSLGKGSEFTCFAVTTSKVDISQRLPLNGFASHCYFDEAKFMEIALASFCERSGYTICRKLNSWPYAKAIVTNVPQERD